MENKYKKIITDLMNDIIKRDNFYGNKEPQYAIIGGEILNLLKQYKIDYEFKNEKFEITGESKNDI